MHLWDLDALCTVHLWDLDALAPVWRDESDRPIGYMFVCEMLAVRLCDLISVFRCPLPWQRDLLHIITIAVYLQCNDCSGLH